MHGKRDAFTGLQYQSVSASDGIGQKPERNHRGEIERSDGRDYAERLGNLHFVPTGAHVFEDVALHHHGNAASYFDVFDAAAQFGFGFGEGFTVFAGGDGGDFVDVFFQQIFQLEQILNAFAGRSSAPRGKGRGRGAHRSVNIANGGDGSPRQYFGRGGINDVREFSGGGTHPAAIHVILQFRRRGHRGAHSFLRIDTECGGRP